MRRFFIALLLLAVIGAALSVAWYQQFANTPVALPSTPFEFSIKPGSSLKSTARQLAESGLPIPAWQFEWLARIGGMEHDLKAGTYRLTAPVSPIDLLAKLRRGEAVLSEITFIEGHTFAQMRKVLAGQGGLKSVSTTQSPTEILEAIGATESHPEGLFFPDTYAFSDGMTDVAILKRAYQTMQASLAKAWAARAPGLPYQNAYEALIMASIVEKETGKVEERARIAAVFVNRLQRGMKLQTDPTVIYGLGERFDGNIRKQDLTADTPYNTYTREGLPPTPIAMPGLAAIEAALNPAATEDIYFVAKGDGSHHFSRSLQEHNRAVNKYQK